MTQKTNGVTRKGAEQFNKRIFGKEPRSFWDDASNLLLVTVVAIFVVFIAFSRVYTALAIDGPSMMPTFNEGYNSDPKAEDIAYYKKLSDNSYARGDIVILNTGTKSIIKRVIGLAGDRINIKADGDEYYVYVNDVKLEEDYILSRADMQLKYKDFMLKYAGEIVVPENSIFVLGDNRGNSTDSVHYGFFNYDSVLGRVDYIVYSDEIPIWSLFLQLFLPIFY